MILVDIYVPSLDKTYDFQVDEKAPVESLIVEITEMIANETRSPRKGDGKFYLCSMDQQRILSGKSTLAECKIRNGCRLMLV